MRLALLLLAGLAACNPYDPSLGGQPFKCGTEEPSCPDGYSCHEYSPSERICEKGDFGPDGGGGGGDGGNVTCNDDSSIEPNDTTGSAWTTPIPDTMPSVSLVQLAICPTSDLDLFRFRVEVNGKNMKATVTTVVADGLLSLRILNGSGTAIATGQAIGANDIVVAVNNLAIGTYFVEVGAGAADVKNNYTIDIVTCDGAPCP